MSSAEPRIVIVTGSRQWPSRRTVFEVLRRHAPTLVVHGGCPTGADEMAHEWCKAWECDEHVVRARWTKEGKRSAGMRRNGRMLSLYPPETPVLAFPYGDSPGTRGCMKLAFRMGHPLEVYSVGGALCNGREVFGSKEDAPGSRACSVDPAKVKA